MSMTLRIDDKGGLIAVEEGKVETVFGPAASSRLTAFWSVRVQPGFVAAPEPKKPAKRYSIFIGGKHAFDSHNAIGERVKILLMRSGGKIAIEVLDHETGVRAKVTFKGKV